MRWSANCGCRSGRRWTFMTSTVAENAHDLYSCAFKIWLITISDCDLIRSRGVSCPGRDAALLALLRRTGTVPNTGVLYGPGSAAHHAEEAARCAASGARETFRAKTKT